MLIHLENFERYEISDKAIEEFSVNKEDENYSLKLKLSPVGRIIYNGPTEDFEVSWEEFGERLLHNDIVEVCLGKKCWKVIWKDRTESGEENALQSTAVSSENEKTTGIRIEISPEKEETISTEKFILMGYLELHTLNELLATHFNKVDRPSKTGWLDESPYDKILTTLKEALDDTLKEID